ncbi:Chemotaxis protein methyltransferase Cher2 [bacterium HR11]|nr:Chemotaxis protein methyltransferase Cher2 [bacterium HR11]
MRYPPLDSSQTGEILSDDLFYAFVDLIYRQTGIRFDKESRFVLQRRLVHRMRALGLPSLERYYYHLLYHPDREREMDQLIDLVTTHETYFFREKRQLRCFVEEIVPLLVQERRAEPARVLRIWSAGCSTGEEPYSIAMLLRGLPVLTGWQLFIFASDISSRALQVARQGIYGSGSFRDMEPEYEAYVRQYFEPTPDGRLRIRDEIRQMVLFGRVNLLDSSSLALYGWLDVIFCRNVLIYFDTEAKKRAIQNFYERLRPGGFLLLGHSESLLGLDSRFQLVHFRNDMVYRK